MKITTLISRAGAFTALAALSAGAAHAQAITPVLTGYTPSAGNNVYTYQLFLGADTRIVSSDIFTFYDFDQLLTTGANAPAVSAPATGVSYNVSVQGTGLNPPGTVALAGDDPAKLNVSLTYTGSTISNATSSAQYLATLTLHSANPKNGVGDFTPFAANSVKNSNSTAAGNQGYVTGPNLSTVTPEPGTWAMFVGMGITGLAAVRRRKLKK